MNKLQLIFRDIYFHILRIFQIFHQFFIPFFKKKQDKKVFCIGFPKTATVSLGKALSILGYRSIHFVRLSFEPKCGWVNYFKKSKYDAYSDAPISNPGMFKKLDKAFPSSKFILTIRDKKSYRKSFENFFRGTSWEIKNEQDLKNQLQKYERHNKQVLEYFKNRPNDLLVLNIIKGDGWEKLCEFLNKPQPDRLFPHKNKSKYNK